MMYHPGYGATVRIPGSDVALVTSVKGDNGGPDTPDEIAAIYADLAKRFPNAEITACTLTDMANAVEPHRSALPVVTQEIGDSWIYGVPSDPLKMARYRELSRLRDAWIAKGSLRAGDATDLALLRHLLLVVEHTWGTDTKTWLDFDNYKPADLARMLETKNYKVVQFSWQEKRQDLLDGVAALPANLRSEAEHAIQSLNPVVPKAFEEAQLYSAEKPIETAHFTLGIDRKTGAITRLRNKATGREWAGISNPIALFTYQTLSQKDYDRFFVAYLKSKADWAFKDFGKTNIEKFGARSQEWQAGSSTVMVEETDGAHRVVANLQFNDDEAFQSGLAAFPRRVLIELVLPKAEPVVHLTLSWFQKPATRLPEAIWLTFNPIAEDRNGWTLDKSGEAVSPFDVVASGNRHMHGLSKGFEYEEAKHSFAVETLDAPVVALGERSPLAFSNRQPDLSAGIHSSLYNNAWGTNYIMWFGEDMRFRFVLRP